MRVMTRVLRWLGAALGLLIVALLAALGLLQTQAGQAWLARTIAQTVSSPDFAVTVEGLSGFVPFRLRADQIDIGDRDGVYLTMHDFELDISAAALLAGRLHIRRLSFAAIEMARSSTAPSTTPLTEYLRVPHLPVGVIVDRFSVDRLVLAPPVLGDSLVARVEGSARLVGETAEVALDIHRTDDSAGNIVLAMELAGATPVLKLQLAASEPTGVLFDRVLGRTDRAPLALSLNGTGPLADWQGRVVASAGTLAHLDADVTLAVAAQTVLGLSATAAVVPLLPTEFAPLIGDRVVVSLRATLGERIVVDPLSIEIAAGKLTGDGAFGGPENAVAAHLRADVPELAPLQGLVGNQFNGSASLTAVVTGTQSRPMVELGLSGSRIHIGSAGVDRIEAEVSATPTGVLDDPNPRIEFAARGRLDGIVTPEGVAVPPELKRP
jgi:translocation and assembly module TamB